jgi:trk system potassium uptake protein
MKLKVVLSYLSLLLLGVGLLMAFPLGLSLYYREPDAPAFLISMGITVGVSLALLLYTRGRREKMAIREALAFVVFSWIAASAFGALPFLLSGALPNYLDALFESVSGFTTNGASVVSAPESLSHGILFWRSFTQWIGGISIIVLFVSIFPILSIGTAYLMESEQAGLPTERATARVSETGRAILWVYLGVSALQAALLLLAGMPVFDAVLTTFSTISTGGFSPRNLSIGAYGSLTIEIIVMAFMIAGAINFHVYSSIFWQRRPGRLLRDVELRVFLVTLILATLVLSFDLFLEVGYSIGDAFRYGAFQAVSLHTTTGFNTANFGLWPAFAQAAIIVVMVIGGSSGSTAGGLKVSRLIVLAKYAAGELQHVFSPRAVNRIRFGDRTLSDSVIARTVGVGILYLATFVVSFLLMTASGLDMVSAASAVVASMATVGPGLGSVVIDYTGVTAFGKVVLMFDMVVARLELWVALAMLSPAFWKWR